jgi:CHAD domain-containing protein
MVTQLTRYRQAPLPTLYRDLLHLSSQTRHGQHGRMAALRARAHPARGRVRVWRASAPGAHVHALRIGNKRLRYAIEALSDVLPKRYRKRLHGKLIARQTELGGIIDDAVAHRLIWNAWQAEPCRGRPRWTICDNTAHDRILIPIAAIATAPGRGGIGVVRVPAPMSAP